MYGGQPIRRPEETGTDAVTRDVRKLFGPARWKRLVLDQKMWGRKTEEAGTKIWAVRSHYYYYYYHQFILAFY